MIRLVHFSDIHLTSTLPDWALRDWFCKRGTSWLNHRLFGRARRFAQAEEIIKRMMDDVRNRRVDQLIFSGDATALGFESEIGRAAEMLRVADTSMPGLAVPGNHDYCTRFAEASGAFERHFAAWQEGRRIGDHRYPFARQVGPVWLIGVNAATGNRLPWDAGGLVGAGQLDRLAQLLAGLPGGLKVLVIHYPVCLASGRPEGRLHGLRDVDALVRIAEAGGVNLWLHGHRHSPYYLQQPGGARFPVICAGTATQHGIWSHGEYVIDGDRLHAIRRMYDADARCFRDVEQFALTLR